MMKHVSSGRKILGYVTRLFHAKTECPPPDAFSMGWRSWTKKKYRQRCGVTIVERWPIKASLGASRSIAGKRLTFVAMMN
jgi:hypothetical protein